MTITCNKLPEKNTDKAKQMSATELKLFNMYQLGKLAQAADPEGAKLVEELMLSFKKTPEEKAELIAKIRKHFGFLSKEEIEAKKRKEEKRLRKLAEENALIYTCRSCFMKIGYKPHRNSSLDWRQNIGICFDSEFRGIKGLQFTSYEEAKAWLIKAESWDEKLYQKELDSNLKKNYFLGGIR